MQQWNRILIVDDEQDSIRLLERFLKDKYTLRSARNGEEALSIIPEFRPDMILLDINMPGMDGYETCRRVRQDPAYCLVKILLVSGYSRLEERLKGYEVGADDYVSKPFDNAEFKAKIDVFMKLKRIEEVEGIKSNLLSLFAHETRTPLAAIIGVSELMTMDTASPAHIQAQADMIYRSAMDLNRFVEKAALLSNLKSGMNLQYVDGSIAVHLKRAVAKLEASAKQKDISLKVKCEPDLELSADWNILGEVIGYILDNAVKYSNRGGTVEARAAADDGMCTIEIEDQGKGIEPQWIEEIFNEFSIQDLVHHQQGQGISLAIAKQIIKMHSGEIQVNSKPNEGSVFTVRLPISGPSSEENAAS